MNLQSLGPQNAHSMDRMEKQQNLENHAEKSRLKDTILANRDSESSEPSAEGMSKKRGVIQNIQAGHFRGVADIRLRINFHEELEIQSSREVARRIEEEAETLDAKVAEKVSGLTEIFELAADFSYSFSFSATIHESRIASPVDPDDRQSFDVSSIIDMFRKTFDGVYDALSALELDGGNNRQDLTAIAGEGADAANLVATAVSQPATPEMAAEPADDATTEVSAFQTALGDLRSFFENELQSIEKRLNEVVPLPTLSHPKGNGLAYDRFLDMYNELYGLTKNSTEKVSSEGEDSIETHA